MNFDLRYIFGYRVAQVCLGGKLDLIFTGVHTERAGFQ